MVCVVHVIRGQCVWKFMVCVVHVIRGTVCVEIYGLCGIRNKGGNLWFVWYIIIIINSGQCAG